MLDAAGIAYGRLVAPADFRRREAFGKAGDDLRRRRIAGEQPVNGGEAPLDDTARVVLPAAPPFHEAASVVLPAAPPFLDDAANIDLPAARDLNRFDARSIGGVGIFPCAGGRDEEAAKRFLELGRFSDWADIRSSISNDPVSIRLPLPPRRARPPPAHRGGREGVVTPQPDSPGTTPKSAPRSSAARHQILLHSRRSLRDI
jgi:hypothetical protein